MWKRLKSGEGDTEERRGIRVGTSKCHSTIIPWYCSPVYEYLLQYEEKTNKNLKKSDIYKMNEL